MPIPVIVLGLIEIGAMVAARAALRQVLKEAAKKAATEAAKKLAAEAAKKAAAEVAKKAVAEVAKKAAAEGAKKAAVEAAKKAAAEAAKKAAKKAAPKAGTKAAPKGTSKANTRPQSHKGKKKKPGPCDHLRLGSGKGDYRGGSHNKTSRPLNDGKDSHHAPAKDSSPLKPADGPAIQMDPADHHLTSSNGKRAGSIKYRAIIRDLIAKGKWDDAMDMEICDIGKVCGKIGQPGKYDEAVKEMREYYECLKKHKLLK
ncbi:TolA protein [Janthinobacterium sp. CG23_2]|nr:TolA protein [Janthinobacterium sp. CG23_2]CUU29268.1 TolA protein [Janthinobacterium sp. CG23_2]